MRYYLLIIFVCMTGCMSGPLIRTSRVEHYGKRWCYIGVQSGSSDDKKKYYVITESGRYGPYDRIDPKSLRYSNDSKWLFCIGSNKGGPGKKRRYYAVINGKRFGPYQDIIESIFDSNVWVYVAVNRSQYKDKNFSGPIPRIYLMGQEVKFEYYWQRFSVGRIQKVGDQYIIAVSAGVGRSFCKHKIRVEWKSLDFKY